MLTRDTWRVVYRYLDRDSKRCFALGCRAFNAIDDDAQLAAARACGLWHNKRVDYELMELIVALVPEPRSNDNLWGLYRVAFFGGTHSIWRDLDGTPPETYRRGLLDNKVSAGDILLVQAQADCTMMQAIRALIDWEGDIVNAILSIQF